MFVLDTDDNGTATNPELASIKPTATATERIDENYAAFVAGQKNFLRDNVNHTIKFTNNVTGLVVNSPDITFMMSDVTKPFVYGVDAKDNMNLEVRLSEAMAEDMEIEVSIVDGEVKLEEDFFEKTPDLMGSPTKDSINWLLKLNREIIYLQQLNPFNQSGWIS